MLPHLQEDHSKYCWKVLKTWTLFWLQYLIQFNYWYCNKMNVKVLLTYQLYFITIQQDFLCYGKVLDMDFTVYSGNTLVSWDKIVHFVFLFYLQTWQSTRCFVDNSRASRRSSYYRQRLLPASLCLQAETRLQGWTECKGNLWWLAIPWVWVTPYFDQQTESKGHEFHIWS